MRMEQTWFEKKDYLDDIYRDGIAEELMDNNELSSSEEAFLRGYNDQWDSGPDIGEA